MIVSDLLASLLELCESENLSDLHVSANTPLMGRFDGRLKMIQKDNTWTEENVRKTVESCLDEGELKQLEEKLSIDVACSHGATRYRINVFHERGYLAMAPPPLKRKVYGEVGTSTSR